ncbi:MULTISPECIES: VapE domain-containing protein [Mycobacteriales]|uniref:VapE family protein n=1 Tax=Gordonia amicalis TaxID=89053 RepID=A0ABU4DEB7_9ACTN|nr:MULTISPECIES: VapE domain-containing protein [Mycobacteriales]MDV6308094.1 VapE family protein [Gordonia amicalis]
MSTKENGRAANATVLENNIEAALSVSEDASDVSNASNASGAHSGVDEVQRELGRVRRYVPREMSAAELLRVREAILGSLMTEWVGSGKNAREVVVDSYANTSLIFRHDPELQHVGINEMGGRLAWRELPTWRKPDDRLRFITNADLAEVTRIVHWYYGARHSSLESKAIEAATLLYAGQNRFSPWRDYLNSLPRWDGVRRIATCIPTARGVGAGGEVEEYLSRVLDSWFLGMMQRAYEPGCQVDSILVLHGGQGGRKSSFFRAIVPDGLVVAELADVPDSNRHKDAMAAAHESPIVLIDELDKLNRKADQAALKAFITGRADTWRAPFGRVNETHKRQFIVAATTNKEDFLVDHTGNRRYWVISVDDVIPEEVLTRQHMDLVLAEARDRYRAGERLDYSAEFEALAERVRAGYVDDPVRDAVYAWLEDPRQNGSTTGPAVDVSRLSVALVCKHVPDLRDVNPTNKGHKQTVERIEAALDAHPSYQRSPKRQRVDGVLCRKSWDKVAPVERTGAEVDQPLSSLSRQQQELLGLSKMAADALGTKRVGIDPEVLAVARLWNVWEQDGRWDSDEADAVVAGWGRVGQRVVGPDKVAPPLPDEPVPGDPFTDPRPHASTPSIELLDRINGLPPVESDEVVRERRNALLTVVAEQGTWGRYQRELVKAMEGQVPEHLRLYGERAQHFVNATVSYWRATGQVTVVDNRVVWRDFKDVEPIPASPATAASEVAS